MAIISVARKVGKKKIQSKFKSLNDFFSSSHLIFTSSEAYDGEIKGSISGLTPEFSGIYDSKHILRNSMEMIGSFRAIRKLGVNALGFKFRALFW